MSDKNELNSDYSSSDNGHTHDKLEDTFKEYQSPKDSNDSQKEHSVDSARTQTVSIQNDTTSTNKDDTVSDPVKTAGFNFNKYFLYTLVAGLTISALLSVIAVMTGEFNSVMSKALSTTGSMVVHTLIMLLLVSWSNQNRSKGTGIILNTLFFITIASFITTILQIWEVITGRIAFDLYEAYVYGFFVSLWIQLLLKMGENIMDKATRVVSYVSIVFSVLFYLLLTPTVFMHYPDTLPEFHYRSLAAIVILLATASVLTIVFRRIYVFKHPELKSLPSSNPTWDVIIACIVLFVGIPFIIGVLSSINSYDSSVDNSEIDNRTSYSTQTPTKSSQPSDRSVTTYTPYRDNATPLSEVKDCSKLAEFQNPRVLFFQSTYTYLSNDTDQKQLSTALTSSGALLQPIKYNDRLSAVDSDCNLIPIASIRKGETIVLYLRVGYTNFYLDALEFIQKVD